MTENRFKKGYCCGDTGLIDNEKEEWFVENINSISDLERNWNDGKTELFIEEKVGYHRALKQLKKKLIKENIMVDDLE